MDDRQLINYLFPAEIRTEVSKAPVQKGGKGMLEVIQKARKIKAKVK